MKNLIKKTTILAFSSLLLSSAAIAGSFTVVNAGYGLVSYEGFTEENGEHIVSFNCGPLQTCVVSDDQWDSRVTYISMQLNHDYYSQTFSIESGGSSLTDDIVLCQVYKCSLSGKEALEINMSEPVLCPRGGCPSTGSRTWAHYP